MTASAVMRPEVYSLRQAAQILGVSVATVQRAIRRGQMPALRLGGRVLIPRRHISRLLAGMPPQRASTVHDGRMPVVKEAEHA